MLTNKLIEAIQSFGYTIAMTEVDNGNLAWNYDIQGVRKLFIKNGQGPEALRSTLAHELGHIVMHTPQAEGGELYITLYNIPSHLLEHVNGGDLRPIHILQAVRELDAEKFALFLLGGQGIDHFDEWESYRTSILGELPAALSTAVLTEHITRIPAILLEVKRIERMLM